MPLLHSVYRLHNHTPTVYFSSPERELGAVWGVAKPPRKSILSLSTKTFFDHLNRTEYIHPNSLNNPLKPNNPNKSIKPNNPDKELGEELLTWPEFYYYSDNLFPEGLEHSGFGALTADVSPRDWFRVDLSGSLDRHEPGVTDKGYSGSTHIWIGSRFTTMQVRYEGDQRFIS